MSNAPHFTVDENWISVADDAFRTVARSYSSSARRVRPTTASTFLLPGGLSVTPWEHMLATNLI
jgi:hypothetical protein